MSLYSKFSESTTEQLSDDYVDLLGLLERLHRLMLDVIKDEFERLGVIELNAVQGLLLFNMGEHEVTAGELKTRGYYQGSNVSYNLKKLVEKGYMHHQRCEIDRRSVRVRLTDKGQEVRALIKELFSRHVEQIGDNPNLAEKGFGDMVHTLKRIERFWTDQIRYIY